MGEQFWGKYRGKVVNRMDPERRARLLVLVPTVSEFPLSWALPCAPSLDGRAAGFAIPEVGANVWVEFEGGNPGFPVWVGVFWERDEGPVEPLD